MPTRRYWRRLNRGEIPEVFDNGLRASALHEIEGGSSRAKVGENGSFLFVAKPAEHLWEVGLQGSGDAIGEAHSLGSGDSEPESALADECPRSGTNSGGRRPFGPAAGLRSALVQGLQLLPPVVTYGDGQGSPRELRLPDVEG